MRIVIIEDEKLTADDLGENIAEIDPSIQVIAKLNSVKNASAWFKKNKHPDLIFSDIQLGDGLSFEIFKNQKITTPVIFCTAYDEYALDAFRANGIDYILKPFDRATIAGALSRYRELEQRFAWNNEQLGNILRIFENRNVRRASILVYFKDKILPVRLENIALFYIENEVTHLITFDGKGYTVNKTLDELEKVSGPDFFRANRQYLVRREAVRDASQYFARSLSVSLNIPFNGTIKVNKVKVTEFLNWLSAT